MTTSETKERTNERLKPIKEAMHDLASDARQGTVDVGNDLARLKNEIIEVVREAAAAAYDGASDKASDAYDSLKRSSTAAAKGLRKNTAAHPLATLAVACGVGLMVGCLMSRGK